MKRASLKSFGIPRGPSELERRFLLYWRACEGPALETEFRFCAGRKWRFDYAHPVARVAIECEGGVYTGGRHTRPLGFIADCDKYNAAAFERWFVFRLTAPQINLLNLTRIVEFTKGRIAVEVLHLN